MKQQPLVSVICQTFNHVNYIKQCIEGFLLQKTNFAIEILIHDDASTDGTASIIREYELKYPDLIKPIYQTENQYSQGKKVFSRIQLPRAQSKYIAICEGDDYWTDPLKLQKQVDFLESNPEYGLIYTKVICYNQTNNKFEKVPWGGSFVDFDGLISRNTIPTLTTVFRSDICRMYLSEIKPETLKWRLGDYPLWLYFSLKSKIFFLNETTGIYRISNGSISHNTNFEKQENYIKSIHAVKIHLLDFFSIKFDELKFEDVLMDNLGTNALLMDDNNKAYSYFSQIKTLTLKIRIKKVISRSIILSFFYKKYTKS